MRRLFSADPRLVLLLAVTVFGAFAWLSRNPESDLVRRAEEWPLVGTLASRFRAAYSAPLGNREKLDGGQRSAGEIDRGEILAEAVISDRVSARPQVWVEPGTRVQFSPNLDSDVLATVELLGNYSVIERRGDWFHIYRYSVDQGGLEGWIRLEGYEDPSSERLQQPEPVLPLAAVEPSPEKVARARSFMEGGGVETPCGPYTLYTAVDGASVSESCGLMARSLEATYRERFGLTPVGEAAESIFLFASHRSYEAFVSDDERIPAEKGGHAAPARGYVALYSEDLPREAVASTLAHELTHLINRRALGPALPPWLSEGLADDLAESRVDDSGRLVPGELGGYTVVSGNEIRHFGGVVSASRLIKALDGSGLPDLSDLVQMGTEEFHAAQRESLLYALSSFWIRFLLSDAPGADPDGFRAFLEAVASGERLTPDLLAQSLDADEVELDASFKTWLRFQAAPLPQAIDFDR